jgi:hypothetical protein
VYANVADDSPTRLNQRRNNKNEFQTNKRNSISRQGRFVSIGKSKRKTLKKSREIGGPSETHTTTATTTQTKKGKLKPKNKQV